VSKALELDFLARAARIGIESFERNLALLTPREREVLEGVVAGRLNKQIAADLNIAEKTIKVHRARVMQKMNVRTTADLVRLVVMRGS
jgi:FixJ family two-component response regulator